MINAPAPLLSAAGLHTYYGASHVLRGVDFQVGVGETVGLMGRNGMGKTTLLKALMGLIPSRQGDVCVRGERVTAHPTHRIAQMGIAYVPEGRGIFGNLSVRENLIMAARPSRRGTMDWSFDRVMAAFPRLKDRLNHGGQQLSGGEQQMLTIGRALMTNPEVLILDEATEGLAPLVAKEIWTICDEIRASGISSVIVDKNWRQVTRVADRTVVLVKGVVAWQGVSSELISQPWLLAEHLGV